MNNFKYEDYIPSNSFREYQKDKVNQRDLPKIPQRNEDDNLSININRILLSEIDWVSMKNLQENIFSSKIFCYIQFDINESTLNVYVSQRNYPFMILHINNYYMNYRHKNISIVVTVDNNIQEESCSLTSEGYIIGTNNKNILLGPILSKKKSFSLKSLLCCK